MPHTVVFGSLDARWTPGQVRAWRPGTRWETATPEAVDYSRRRLADWRSSRRPSAPVAARNASPLTEGMAAFRGAVTAASRPRTGMARDLAPALDIVRSTAHRLARQG